MNKKNKSGQFRIVGYSTGAVVAVELARKLEAKGLKCKLILIDGAPSYLKKAAELMLPDKSKEDEFEDKFLLNAMTSISDKHVEEVRYNFYFNIFTEPFVKSNFVMRWLCILCDDFYNKFY